MPRDANFDRSQFYIPKDKLTKLYNEILDKNDRLPPSFYNDNTDESL